MKRRTRKKKEGFYVPGYGGVVLDVEDVRAILEIVHRRDRRAWQEIVVWLSQEKDGTLLSRQAKRAFQGALMEWRMQSQW